MINELQVLAVAAFLLWGLASAVCDAWVPDDAHVARECSEGRQSDQTEQPSVHTR
ncbi:hypothetical protein PDG61_30935 [Mycolicibacterium sp. BiH015]|uniref:hypothetical protein n=1 Tax=Mycolicibacterium sp. BiH015 TaxID=3018808 RepID=UPI0022DF6CDE|nr:hypothetical protein [Mycolicibacterium sp. BiH015]MDA2895360.1 hypothetical protein [Mycolicibacterium sp. BiH015]